jgi:hypothetical protein
LKKRKNGMRLTGRFAIILVKCKVLGCAVP